MARTVGALVAMAGASVAYRAVTGRPPVPDWLAARLPHADEEGRLTVKRAVTILRPREDVYAFWRDVANLPSSMEYLREARVLEARDNELVRWESVPGARVPNHGEVRFQDAPAGRGTEVRLWLEYEPPAGAVGASVAQVLGHGADRQIRETLRQFKQLMEAGEVPTNDGQPMGNCL